MELKERLLSRIRDQTKNQVRNGWTEDERNRYSRDWLDPLGDYSAFSIVIRAICKDPEAERDRHINTIVRRLEVNEGGGDPVMTAIEYGFELFGHPFEGMLLDELDLSQSGSKEE
jgi:hypothetical protein